MIVSVYPGWCNFLCTSNLCCACKFPFVICWPRLEFCSVLWCCWFPDSLDLSTDGLFAHMYLLWQHLQGQPELCTLRFHFITIRWETPVISDDHIWSELCLPTWITAEVASCTVVHGKLALKWDSSPTCILVEQTSWPERMTLVWPTTDSMYALQTLNWVTHSRLTSLGLGECSRQEVVF